MAVTAGMTLPTEWRTLRAWEALASTESVDSPGAPLSAALHAEVRRLREIVDRTDADASLAAAVQQPLRLAIGMVGWLVDRMAADVPSETGKLSAAMLELAERRHALDCELRQEAWVRRRLDAAAVAYQDLRSGRLQSDGGIIELVDDAMRAVSTADSLVDWLPMATAYEHDETDDVAVTTAARCGLRWAAIGARLAMGQRSWSDKERRRFASAAFLRDVGRLPALKSGGGDTSHARVAQAAASLASIRLRRSKGLSPEIAACISESQPVLQSRRSDRPSRPMMLSEPCELLRNLVDYFRCWNAVSAASRPIHRAGHAAAAWFTDAASRSGDVKSVRLDVLQAIDPRWNAEWLASVVLAAANNLMPSYDAAESSVVPHADEEQPASSGLRWDAAQSRSASRTHFAASRATGTKSRKGMTQGSRR